MTTITSQASNMPSAASPSGSCLKDSRFSCNICLDPVAEPVVTQCGHLYCWSCLYRWLEPGILPEERKGLLPQSAQFGNAIVDTSRRRCPVCKSECSVPTLIPLYVRNDHQQQEQTHCTTIKKSRRKKRSSMKRKAINSDLQQQQQQSSDEVSISTTEDDHSINSLSDNSIDNQDGITRRRLRFHNNHTGNEAMQQTLRNNENQAGTNNNNNSETPFVPSRPPAPSPLRRSPGDSSNATATVSNNTQTTPRHVNPISSSTHRPSLSHGLALSLWQTLFGQERRGRGGSPRRLSLQNSTASSSSSSSSSLDQQQQQFLMPPTSPEDGQTAEFLSRLLVMLGSFVIFCLVWF